MLTRRQFIKRSLIWIPVAPTILRGQGLKFSDQAFLMSTGVASPSYTYYGTDFDGTNDYLSIASITGLADGKLGLVSFWFNMTGKDSANNYFLSGYSDNLRIYRSTDNCWYAAGANAAATLIYRAKTVSTYSTASNPGWHHICFAWDLNAGTEKNYLYVDGASNIESKVDTDDTINYDYVSHTGWTIGAHYDATGKLSADLCEVYVNLAETLDISIAANLQKFRSAGGKPVSLGPTGALPTGNQPFIYLNNPYATFQTNKGSGGNWSVVGALTAAGSLP